MCAKVDFCSGACLLVLGEAYSACGGFDELYVPAYYEDPDLCFSLREMGYRVIFQPDVWVFHNASGSRSIEKFDRFVR